MSDDGNHPEPNDSEGEENEDEEWEEDVPENIEDRRRVARAIRLAEKNPERWVPVLLGMLTETDLDECGDFELRTDVMTCLRYLGGAAERAVMWVAEAAQPAYELHGVFYNSDGPHSGTRAAMTEDEHRKVTIQAFAHLVAATELDEYLRRRAIDEYLRLAGEPGYHQLGSIAPDINVETFVHGDGYGGDEDLRVLRDFVAQDPFRPMNLRIDIVDTLWDDSPREAAYALAAVMEELPLEGGPERLLRLLSTLDKVKVDALLSDAEMDEELRGHSRFCTAVREALDATHVLHPLGRIGDVLHTWVCDATTVHWGGDSPTGGHLEPADKTAMIDIAAQYERWRSEDLVDDWSAHSHRQGALFESDDRWHRFTVAGTHQFLYLDRHDVRCALYLSPPLGTSLGSRWRMALEDRGSCTVARFEGAVTNQLAGSSVGFPDDLLRRPDWAGLLLKGLAELD
ncbi:hypothetical protein [Streptomyces sp. WZ-12]|uniref:hypothetical protein n=1 Tax=Streptomyces sp. WZ-12 TaxID=3030210 RepID=UPI00238190AD|nr:hypothetical protein [Streptomyces sp. WZ-12]